MAGGRGLLAHDLDRLNRALSARYRVERKLGHGGMAAVYLARDLRHDRPVALKVLREELTASLGAERFLREIRLTARLDHPHILPLLDSGEADGLLYYVMPYVEGESLRDRLNRVRHLPLNEALAIAREVADALGYAHSHGILHRDIKPENILLAGGHARLADFGVARAVTTAGDETLTVTGVTVGTPLYMSPEQATGEKELDARSDLYSLGCVLYEMLAGAAPFVGNTPQAIIARKCMEPAPSLRSRMVAVPRDVEQVIMRSLSSAIDERFPTADEMASALARSYSDAVPRAAITISTWRPLLRSTKGLGLVALLLAVLGASGWAIVRSATGRWATEKALPEIKRLVEHKDLVAAYRLARRAERYLRENPEFQRIWHGSTLPLSIRTVPSGARVSITDYRAPEGDWDVLGTSPIHETRIPAANLRFRIEKAGFHALEGTLLRELYAPVLELSLHSQNDHPGMPPVPGGSFHFWSIPAARVEPYWLDRYEVTSRAFKEFVDRGGYRERRFWLHPMLRNGRIVEWEEGIDAFVDRTGRHGPSTWELGTFPDGSGDFPVGGVSWYEAAAYCEYAGKKLPTLYHWFRAAGLSLFSDILALSNLGGRGPAPVGSHRAMGPYGHYDMAGNLREWTLNPIRDRRYILGGAWTDPGYMFLHPDAVSPDDRSPKNGFRCASYGAESGKLLGVELDAFTRQYVRKPVSDDVFRAYKNLYVYDPRPLNARIESVDEASPHWRREIVSFDAPYGRERISAHVFLPKAGRPPFQAVVYYPGAEAFGLQSSRDMQTWVFEFLVRTGRAVIQPVYDGTYERRPGSALFREQVIHWAMDVSRSIDYLETRPDINADRVAYYGFSSGVVWGPIFTAIEKRFKASVFFTGGLLWQRLDPEIEPANFAPRATAPVLMVNGRDDFIFPVETSQLPLFRLLGAPNEHKRHALLDGGHLPSDLQAVMKEVLNWLDRYLGPAKTH
jgi:eukaryotic-like serine/threonine-protein kinase